MKDKDTHLKVIKDVLRYINAKGDSPFILKGGTALSLYYSLNRFSEDIDLDAPGNLKARGRFFQEIKGYCEKMGYNCRVDKNTETTQRAYIDYGKSDASLKVEVSYRRKEIPESLVRDFNGVRVYCLDEMARLKAAAYSGRDRIRDLYDVTYLCTYKYDELNESARDALRTALEYKDFEQFDYIIASQDDELIDKDQLETMFLQAFDNMGLLSPKRDEEVSGIDLEAEELDARNASASLERPSEHVQDKSAR